MESTKKYYWLKRDYYRERQHKRYLAHRQEISEKNRAFRATHSEEVYLKGRKDYLFRCYKLTLEDFQNLLEKQQYRCPCGFVFHTSAKSRFYDRAQVDHSHACCPGVKSCGKCVRGLLCRRCNVVLGLLEEEPRLLPQYLVCYLSQKPLVCV